jgi:copper chaperone CopZ
MIYKNPNDMKKIVLFFALCAMPLCYAQEPVDAQTGASQPTTQTEQKPVVKQSNKQTVVLHCDLHCQGCCDKIMKNIAFEKGVKDLVCDLKTKTVTVTYDTRKTDLDTLLQAFSRIGKPATVVE